jgi:RHS repeat-associated protein
MRIQSHLILKLSGAIVVLMAFVLSPQHLFGQGPCPPSAPGPGTAPSGCPGPSYDMVVTAFNNNAVGAHWYTTAGGSTQASYSVTNTTSGGVMTSKLSGAFPSTVTFWAAAYCSTGGDGPRTAVTFTSTQSSVSVSANMTASAATPGLVLSASGGSNYAWRRGSSTNGMLASNASSYAPPYGGTYYVDGTPNCSGTSTASITVNFVPVANAGQTQYVALPVSSYTFYGSGYDVDGDQLTFNWRFVSGPNTQSDLAANYNVINSPIAGTYVYEFKATDPQGQFSTSTVQIICGNFPNNYNSTTQENIVVSGQTTDAQVAALGLTGKSTSITYQNGKGQTMQAITKQASPTGYDVVQPVTYDDMGRQAQNFLAVTQTQITGNYIPAILSYDAADPYNPAKYAGSPHQQFYQASGSSIPYDAAPYSKALFESSPLTRPLTVGSEGSAWQPGTGSSSAITYGTNATGAVRSWTAGTTGYPTTSGAYPAGTLNMTQVTDEASIITQTYTNREGYTILRRTQSSQSPSGYIETYYVYDTYNNLRFELTPEFIRKYPTGTGALTITSGDVDMWCFQYLYDNLNRTIQSKSPGIGWKYFIYDKRDRVVLTQDGNQRNNNQWSYTKYDEMNRSVITGIYSPGSNVTQSTMQSNVNALASGVGYQNIMTSIVSGIKMGLDFVITSYEGINEYRAVQSIVLKPGFGFVAGVTGTSFRASIDDGTGSGGDVFPTSGDNAVSITYYDDYTNCTPCQDANYQYVTESWNSSLTNSDIQKYTSVRGKIVSSLVKNLSTGSMMPTVAYYNKRGQLLQSISANHLGGFDRASALADFSGKKLEELESYIGYNSGGINTIRKTFTYDGSSGRNLVNVKHKINNQPEIIMGAFQYNELGQVVKKSLHSTDNGSSYLQAMDYRYNIRGWLTNINNIAAGDDSNDFFKTELAYNSVLGSGNTARTDGSLTGWRWREDLTAKEKAYNFGYTDIGQYASSSYKRSSVGVWNLQPSYFNEENVTYDLNGNIQTLIRNRENFNGTSYTLDQMDNLTYTYGPNTLSAGNNGNQLQYVKENSTSANKALGFNDGSSVNTLASPDYVYDANGNLTKDGNKGIDTISYYHNNLPKRVHFTSGYYLVNSYDAAGRKMRTVYYNNLGVLQSTTDYVGGIVLLNGAVLLVNTEAGRITAPTYSNLIENKEGAGYGGYTANGTVTITSEYLNSQTYVKAVCGQSSGTPGMWPIKTVQGDILSVKSGETYSIRVLGYQSIGTNAYIYVSDQGTGTVLWTGAQLPVGSANENWVSSSITIPSGVTGIKVGVLWNGGGTGNTVYINRVALYKTDFEYNYFLRDHQGNTRVVLQTNPGTQVYTATMETENQSANCNTDPSGENCKFLNMNSSSLLASPGNTTPGGSKAYRMNSTYNIGPAKSIKVYPGETFSISVYSYYTSTSGYTAGSGLMAAAAGVFGGVSGAVGDPGSIYSSMTTNNFGALGFGSYRGTSAPSAYLNYIIFDKDFNLISGQATPMPATPNAPQLITVSNTSVSELGYVYVYLSYDNAAGGDVYFDDLKITVKESAVIQVNNYYPYGMVSDTWLREGEIDNAYLYQGKELIAQTGWHDFGSRMYYADLGRWLSADPADQFASPYLGMGNLPMSGTDPNGEAFLIDDVIVAAVGFVVGYVSYAATHHSWFSGRALASGLLGAAIAEVGYVTLGVGFADMEEAGSLLGGGTMKGGVEFAAGYGASVGASVYEHRDDLAEKSNARSLGAIVGVEVVASFTTGLASEAGGEAVDNFMNKNVWGIKKGMTAFEGVTAKAVSGYIDGLAEERPYKKTWHWRNGFSEAAGAATIGMIENGYDKWLEDSKKGKGVKRFVNEYNKKGEFANVTSFGAWHQNIYTGPEVWALVVKQGANTMVGNLAKLGVSAVIEPDGGEDKLKLFDQAARREAFLELALDELKLLKFFR